LKIGALLQLLKPKGDDRHSHIVTLHTL